MDSEQFKIHGKNMVDYLCNYVDTIEQKEVSPKCDPGFLRPLLPSEAPQNGECFDKILKDFDKHIMQGVLHWNHPHFHAYFPSGNSFPSVLADMLSSTLGTIGFSWASCPASTELETIVLDWYAKALDLPEHFLTDHPSSTGGGVLQGSASECVYVCMMAARDRALKVLKGQQNVLESVFLPKLVCYTSKDAHSCIEKAARMSLVQLRLLNPDDRGRLRGVTLQAAIKKDVAAGLTPFMVIATYGTTGTAAFDCLAEIGTICAQYPSIWYHVDGAYAGNSWIVPELRHFRDGIKYADSFNTNPNKLLLTAFDASAMWVKDVMKLQEALTVNPLYLQHKLDKETIDYRHYGIPLSRRFRSLKLWFVFRSYGIAGLQNYVRNHIRHAKKFEQHIRSDRRFEVVNEVNLGLVCFRLIGSDEMNIDLLGRLNHNGKIHMVPAKVNGKYSIRFAVVYEHATDEHMDYAWAEVKTIADEILPVSVPQNVALLNKQRQKLTRSQSSRFSFTRSVSREVYERQQSIPSLSDGATPIIVLDTNEILNGLHILSVNGETDSTPDDESIE